MTSETPPSVSHRTTLLLDPPSFSCTCGVAFGPYDTILVASEAMEAHTAQFAPDDEGEYRESYGELGSFLNEMRHQLDHIEAMLQELGNRLLPTEARGTMFDGLEYDLDLGEDDPNG